MKILVLKNNFESIDEEYIRFVVESINEEYIRIDVESIDEEYIELMYCYIVKKLSRR